MREYRYKPRINKLRIRRRMLALGVAAVLGVTGISLIKHFNAKKVANSFDILPESPVLTEPPKANEDWVNVPTETIDLTEEYPAVEAYYEEPQQVTYMDNGTNKGDSVVATSNVNMRLNADKDSFKVGELPKGSVVDRILSTDNWDLVRYGNRIAYVSSDYTRENEIDYNNEYYYVEECNDVVRTTSKLYFRYGPSTNEQDICLLDKKAELVVIGRAIPYSNPDDVWYLVKYKDQMGFVKASYTVSLKDILRSTNPEITDLTILNIGFAKGGTPLINSNGEQYKRINQYQLVKVLMETPDFYLVEYGDSIGYVHKNDIKIYQGKFVVVDLSDQKVYMYCNTDMVFEDNCTTGKDSTKTRPGLFKVSERTNSRYFSEDAQARYMWARFDGGNGFHDAPWEDAKNFGNDKFRKRSGSKGCVRLPDEAAIFLKDYIKEGTKVAVKE